MRDLFIAPLTLFAWLNNCYIFLVNPPPCENANCYRRAFYCTALPSDELWNHIRCPHTNEQCVPTILAVWHGLTFQPQSMRIYNLEIRLTGSSRRIKGTNEGMRSSINENHWDATSLVNWRKTLHQTKTQWKTQRFVWSNKNVIFKDKTTIVSYRSTSMKHINAVKIALLNYFYSCGWVSLQM